MSKRSGGTPYKIATAIKVARRLYSQFSPRSTPTSRPTRAYRDTVTGHYQGRLPTPKRQAKPGKIALYGHRLELERYGTAAHANVCYLGAQVAPASAIGKSVGVAFLRMVMKRHYQIEYSSVDQAIRPLASGTGLGGSVANSAFDYFPHAIKFWRKVTGSNGVPLYEVPLAYTFPAPGASATVAAFADWFCANIFLGGLYGAGDAVLVPDNRVELHAYQFVHFDGARETSTGVTVLGGTVNQAVMPLEGQYLTAYAVTRMHIQNVTPADGASEAGATLLSTRVDANPIKGKLMRFTDPTPIIKDDRGLDGTAPADFGYKLQLDNNGDGIIWPNQATPPSGPWTQLPSADMFRNCAGMANISLEPGAIKDYSLSFKFSGTIQNLMRGFNTSEYIVDTVGRSRPLPSTKNKQFGQSFMFALEKRMPTGPALVSVNFHYELYAGSVFGSRRKTPMTRETLEPSSTVAD